MDSKILAGFAATAVLASGLTYFVARRSAPVAPAPVVAPVAQPEPAPPVLITEEPPVVAVPKKPVAGGQVRIKKQENPQGGQVRVLQPVPEPVVEKAELPPVAEVIPPAPDVAPAPVPVPAEEPSKFVPFKPRPEAPRVNTATLSAGTSFVVRLAEQLSSKSNVAGDTFAATLDAPLVADGFVLAERGARVTGKVIQVNAGLALELIELNTSDGQAVPIRTARFEQKNESSRNSDIAKVGGGAALGAIIGAIAGGGKGAAIGAAAGGAAGGGVAAATRNPAVVLRPETRLNFRLEEAVTLTERR